MQVDPYTVAGFFLCHQEPQENVVTKLPTRAKKNREHAVSTNGYDPGELLNEFEAAEFLGLSVHWLRQSRVKHPKWAGPKYVQPDGYHIRYNPDHLREFMATRNGGPRVIDPAVRMKEAS